VLPIALDETERRQLEESAKTLREMLRELGY
jgi:hypothetical protein